MIRRCCSSEQVPRRGVSVTKLFTMKPYALNRSNNNNVWMFYLIYQENSKLGKTFNFVWKNSAGSYSILKTWNVLKITLGALIIIVWISNFRVRSMQSLLKGKKTISLRIYSLIVLNLIKTSMCMRILQIILQEMKTLSITYK